MNLVDIILVVIFLLIIWEGYARGFVVSVLSLARVAIGIPLCYFFAKNLSEPFYNSAFRDGISSSVTHTIEGSSLEDTINGIREGVSSMPEALRGNVDLSFINNISSDTATKAIMENVVDPVAVIICKIVVFILAIIVFFVVTGIIIALIKGLGKSKHAPFRRTNKFLGAVLGTIKAAIIIFTLAAVGNFFIVYFGSADGGLISQLEASAVIEFINKFNPLLIV